MINEDWAFSNCLFLFSTLLYLLVKVFIKVTNGIVITLEEDNGFLCVWQLNYVSNFADSRVEVGRYGRMDNGYLSHRWNLLGSMLFSNVTIKHLFVEIRKAPFGNTNIFSRIFKFNEKKSKNKTKQNKTIRPGGSLRSRRLSKRQSNNFRVDWIARGLLQRVVHILNPWFQASLSPQRINGTQ